MARLNSENIGIFYPKEFYSNLDTWKKIIMIGINFYLGETVGGKSLEIDDGLSSGP